MCGVEKLYARVLTVLSGWRGYGRLAEVMEKFQKFEIYLAGGAVRDVILGRHQRPKDFDLFLDGESLEAVFSSLANIGRMDIGPLGCPRWFPGLDGTEFCDLVPIDRFDQPSRTLNA